MTNLAVSQAMNLPVLDQAGGLRRYIRQIHEFPILTLEMEIQLGQKLKLENNLQAAQQLITSHLRMVPKIANKYRGYGLPIEDVIAEGNIGLMKAVRRFDPDKGFRLATYAMWWIRSSIQEYILKTVSIVKIGSTASQKQLFFGLRRAKERIKAYGNYLSVKDTKTLAENFNVSEAAITAMNSRLSAADQSLNSVIGDEEGNTEIVDTLVDNRILADEEIINRDENSKRKILLNEAINTLKDKEKEILIARRLSDPVSTLNDLSIKYNLSRERIRQIENKAVDKIKKFVGGAFA